MFFVDKSYLDHARYSFMDLWSDSVGRIWNVIYLDTRDK